MTTPDPLQTSAGIGVHAERELLHRLRREAVTARIARAVGSGILALGLAGAAVFALEVVGADQQLRCDSERDQSGYGRKAALRAMEAPEAQSRFLYRVSQEPNGYRVRVVVSQGPFLGDAWERDSSGQIRHLSDVCRDQSDGHWAAVLDAAVIDGA